MLFKLVLPALAINHLPLPLGGTSNHFRIDVLRQVGGWDPYNVTEDADIGIRLARCGFYAKSLASCTYEEANTELHNWLQHRALDERLSTKLVGAYAKPGSSVAPGWLHRFSGGAGHVDWRGSVCHFLSNIPGLDYAVFMERLCKSFRA